MKEESTYHESQVNVSFSRINGGNQRFYGSDIECNSYIELTVSKSSVTRDLGHDWFFPKTKPPIPPLRYDWK